jgi:hypothetical protein
MVTTPVGYTITHHVHILYDNCSRYSAVREGRSNELAWLIR